MSSEEDMLTKALPQIGEKAREVRAKIEKALPQWVFYLIAILGVLGFIVILAWVLWKRKKARETSHE